MENPEKKAMLVGNVGGVVRNSLRNGLGEKYYDDHDDDDDRRGHRYACACTFLLLHILPYNEYHSTTLHLGYVNVKKKENIGVFFLVRVKFSCYVHAVVADTTANGTRQNRTKPKTGEGRAIIKLKKYKVCAPCMHGSFHEFSLTLFCLLFTFSQKVLNERVVGIWKVSCSVPFDVCTHTCE